MADIEATRAELGDTVDALSAKFDVKAQARQGLDDARERASSQARAAQQRGSRALAQVKDAATDDHGNLTQQARIAAFAAAALVTATTVAAVRRRRR